MKITKDMTIKEVLNTGLSAVMTLKRYGLNCLHCSTASEETLEIGAKRHNADIEKLLNDLNQ